MNCIIFVIYSLFYANIRSGSVCLDVINQTWSPMFGNIGISVDSLKLTLDMINIFEVFLPQLLRYPNPTDPLNGEAAALLMREPSSYETKVRGSYKLTCYYFKPSFFRICEKICYERGCRCRK